MASAARIFVVTGSNKGIGYATVAGLCAKVDSDAIVYLTARSVERGTVAVAELAKKGLSAKFHQLDVDDATSIQNFATYLKKEHGGLDVLVNNAATAYMDGAPEPFSEKAKVVIRVNYFGLQAVCKALFPLLRSHGRVVNLSSSAGHLTRVPGEDLRGMLSSPDLTEAQLDDIMKDFVKSSEDGSHIAAGWMNSTYGASKVGVSALSRLQQQQFDKDTSRQDILVNHCHPGFTDTDMTEHKGPLTINQGAVVPIYLSMLPRGITSPKGDYVWLDKTIVDWVNGPMPSY